MKLVIEEPESAALERHLGDRPVLAVSRIAVVEVGRATTIANPSPAVREEAKRLLDGCLLVDVSDRVLRDAAGIASARVRTIDAIHLATALRVEPDEFVAYDRRLAKAAAERGLAFIAPGAPG